MADSYFSAIGRGADAPPNISKTNYLETTVDMSEAVNKNIDETQERINQHFDQLIGIYNHMHEQGAKRPQQLVDLFKQGAQTSKDLNEFLDYYDTYSKFSNKWNKHRTKFDQDPKSIIWGGRNWNQVLGDVDGDVEKENVLENNRNKVRQESNRAASLVKDADPGVASELAAGTDGSYLKELEMHETLDSLKQNYPAWRTMAEEGMKVHIGNFTPEGQPIFQSYNESSYHEKDRVSEVINAWYAYNNQGAARNRVGLYKKDFISFMNEKELTRRKVLLEDSAAAVTELHKETSAKELLVKMKSDPQWFVKTIQINVPHFKDANGVESYGLTRKFFTDQVIRGIETGVIRRSHIEDLGDSVVNPHYAPTTEVKVKKYWEKDYDRMIAALSKAEKAELQAEKDDLEGQKASKIVDILKMVDERDEPLTYKEREEILTNFKADLGIQDDERLPDELKNLKYKGHLDDELLEDEINYNYSRGELPTLADIRGFESTEKRKFWRQKIEAGIGLRKGSDAPGTLGWRNSAVRTAVNGKTLETTAGKEKSNVWQANYENAILAYNDEFLAAKETGAGDVAAHNIAMAAVNKGLFNQITNDQGRQITPWDTRPTGDFDIPAAKEEIKTAKAILANKDLLNQEEEFKGEGPNLLAAAKYYQSKGPRPEYYKTLARRIGMRPDALMRARLIATGRLKDGELVFPEEENLSPADERKLTFKPTASNTYQVTKENEDYTWMLDTVKSPDAEENGGYLAIKNPDGKYTNIETVVCKPIKEITMGDVYSLIMDGYTNLGAYDITPAAFKSLIESNAVPIDESWDKKDQDLLFLARLRQKAQQSQQYVGANGRYRRLVHIPEKDHERFKKIAGDLPTWLELDTLLPEVAKELVKQVTQN